MRVATKNHNNTALLRENGFRATRGRLELLAALKGSSTPLSATEIARKVGQQLSQANIYRSLEALADKGILRRIDLGHGHADYEFAPSGAHHHHLICRTCGKIEDVVELNLRPIEKKVLSRAKEFRKIDDHALEFFGTCKACARS